MASRYLGPASQGGHAFHVPGEPYTMTREQLMAAAMETIDSFWKRKIKSIKITPTRVVVITRDKED